VNTLVLGECAWRSGSNSTTTITSSSSSPLGLVQVRSSPRSASQGPLPLAAAPVACTHLLPCPPTTQGQQLLLPLQQALALVGVVGCHQVCCRGSMLLHGRS
jgi:hypothetical protein